MYEAPVAATVTPALTGERVVQTAKQVCTAKKPKNPIDMKKAVLRKIQATIARRWARYAPEKPQP